jgi:uncharacterized membrane protein
MNIGTPFGLAFASGINAYLPLLSFALAARWLHLYNVHPPFAFITSDWCLIVLVMLTVLDVVADKIPVLDHVWDTTQTVIRPLMGALVAAAASPNWPGTIQLSLSGHYAFATVLAAISAAPLGGIRWFLVMVLGGLLAAMSHAVKATTRLISTLTTAGLFNPVLSFLEDGFVLLVILLSLFVPVVMLILLVFFIVFFGPRLLRGWSDRLGGR